MSASTTFTTPRPYTRTDPVDAFWAKVGPPLPSTPQPGCRLWLRTVDARGHGRHGGTTHPRFAWSALHGAIPAGHVVRATVCDNPLCCEPVHLTCTPRAKASARRKAPPLPLGVYRLQVQVSSTLHDYVAGERARLNATNAKVITDILKRFMVSIVGATDFDIFHLLAGDMRTPWGLRDTPRRLVAPIPTTLHRQLTERFKGRSLPLIVEAALRANRHARILEDVKAMKAALLLEVFYCGVCDTELPPNLPCPTCEKTDTQ